MPAKAGIQFTADLFGVFKRWIPAFAGMTNFYRSPLILFGLGCYRLEAGATERPVLNLTKTLRTPPPLR